MRVTQGAFSFLPDLTDEQVLRQLAHALCRGWSLSIEHTDDPHPRNVYWDLWTPPMLDGTDPASALAEVRACRHAWPDRYVKVSAFDATRGWETVRLSFLVQRPAVEPRLALERQEAEGRRVRYALRVLPAGGSDRVRPSGTGASRPGPPLAPAGGGGEGGEGGAGGAGGEGGEGGEYTNPLFNARSLLRGG